MAISTDYPRPITVNGFVCRNCDDVSKARKFEDPSASSTQPPATRDDAVTFGGALAGMREIGGVAVAPPARQALDRYA